MKWRMGALTATMLILGAGVASAGHQFSHGNSGTPSKQFAGDFVPPKDSEWGWDLGGFGGEQKGKTLAYNPVIFVHGNSEDQTFFDVASESPPTVVNVRKKYKAAGYADQEVWALAYNGVRCGSNACGTANTVNLPDMFNFIQAVRSYTGAAKVDIVAHSLGVTILRRTVKDHPELLDQIEDFVGSAGANHGTSSCRGSETTVYGCNEIVPGSAWLADLNSWNPKGEGDETPGPVRYMTIFDGSGVGDQFFLNLSPLYDDSKSPRLSGADNRQLPNTPHFTLVRGQDAINLHLPFVRDNNNLARADGGPVTTPEARAAERSRGTAATGPPSWSRLGPMLLLAGLLLWAALRISRRRPAA